MGEAESWVCQRKQGSQKGDLGEAKTGELGETES